jgi:7,8-dihydroneopterin aldolase/epimerase/oxygenase
MSQIILKNMEFYAYHGHFTEEQKIGNRFTVSLIIDTDLSRAASSDDLDDTIDYSRVYEIVKQEMMVPSRLLEHVAGRIADALHKNFRDMAKTTVKVTKLNPSLGGKTESVSVVITK